MLGAQFAVLAFATVALAAASCGRSSKPATSTTTAAAPSTSAATTTAPAIAIARGKSLTRAKWLAQGDAICAHVNREVAAISVRSAAEYASAMHQIVAYYDIEASSLSKLVPPPSMASDAARLVSGVQVLIESLNRAGQAFQAGQGKVGFQLLGKAMEVQRQPIAVARHAGLKKCTATT